MQQSKTRNGPISFDELARNTCCKFRSPSKQTSKWITDSISNDVTAHTLNLPNESRLSSLKNNPNERLSHCKQNRSVSNYMRDSDDGKFLPQQNIFELLQNFQGPFCKILDCCATKYVQLVRQCENEYKYLKQILTHYPESKHLPSYFNQMHVNSTDTKINLLKMLTDVSNKLKRKEQKLKDQMQENQQLKLEVLKLKKLSKSKDQAYLGQVQNTKELKEKIVQLEGRVKGLQNECQQLQQRQSRYKQDLRDKEGKMKKMEADKQNMKKQVQQIEKRMQLLKLHDKQISEKPKIKQKIKNMACKEVPEVDKICEDVAKRRCERANSQTDEDLYRCLLIQACTIEADLLEQ